MSDGSARSQSATKHGSGSPATNVGRHHVIDHLPPSAVAMRRQQLRFVTSAVAGLVLALALAPFGMAAAMPRLASGS